MIRKIKWLVWQFVLCLGGMSCVLLMFVGAVALTHFFDGKVAIVLPLAMIALAVIYIEEI